MPLGSQGGDHSNRLPRLKRVRTRPIISDFCFLHQPLVDLLVESPDQFFGIVGG